MPKKHMARGRPVAHPNFECLHCKTSACAVKPMQIHHDPCILMSPLIRPSSPTSMQIMSVPYPSLVLASVVTPRNKGLLSDAFAKTHLRSLVC